jgi:uncharacterized protein (DUF1330 family)
MKKLITGMALFALGTGFGITLAGLNAAEQAAKPAFLIVSADRNAGVSNADYAPYQQAAGPLARAAGLSMVATSQAPEVLEGEWPYGNVALEQFASMEALREFWYSEGYQEAKKLREGLSKINFIVAVEGD